MRGVPAEVNALVGRMLAKTAAERPSMVAVAQELARLAEQPLTAQPTPTPRQPLPLVPPQKTPTMERQSYAAGALEQPPKPQRPLWLAAAAIWLLGAPLLLKRGVAGWPRLASGFRLLLGAVILSAAWLGMMQLRLVGINTLLSAMCLVWLADTGAYAAGRALGKRKLAPSISPGKSWEGAAGGLLAVLLLAAFWLWLDGAYAAQIDAPSLYTQLQRKWGWLGLGAALLLLTAMSVVGDLFESLMKRACGVKDSSQLLPGHGGVLDRIDALLPTFILAMAFLAL